MNNNSEAHHAKNYIDAENRFDINKNNEDNRS